MKTPILNIKNKGILFLVILSTVSSSVFSQNKLVSLIYSVNFNFAIPVVCVIGLGVFLFTSFLKQKNH
ncbi:MAG TPA: hypothetical protein PKZ75_13900 [Bacteroidia bacterium]|nr:hypothetical protein [Bacteroidia bacterium]